MTPYRERRERGEYAPPKKPEDKIETAEAVAADQDAARQEQDRERERETTRQQRSSQRRR